MLHYLSQTIAGGYKKKQHVVAFVDNKSYDTDFLGNIRITAWTQAARNHHYVNPFEIVRSIQLCRGDFAGMVS